MSSTRQAAGSHEIWYNPHTHCYTIIPNHPGDMPEGTLRAILRQTGIETAESLRGVDKTGVLNELPPIGRAVTAACESFLFIPTVSSKRSSARMFSS